MGVGLHFAEGRDSPGTRPRVSERCSKAADGGLKGAKAGRVALATAGVARMLDEPSGANLCQGMATGAGKGETA